MNVVFAEHSQLKIREADAVSLVPVVDLGGWMGLSPPRREKFFDFSQKNRAKKCVDTV
jgi:hypothetical protein